MRKLLRGPDLSATLALAGFLAVAVHADISAANPPDADPSGSNVGTSVATVKLAPDQAIPPAALEAFVDGAMMEGMQTAHVAGAAVAIVQDGRTVLLKGYGIAGVDPVRAVDPARTLFRIASMSKTFTWILLMKEVERGRIRLDAPLNDYLPPELQFSAQGFRKPIRILDLMSHATGLDTNELTTHPAVDRGERVVALEEHLRRAQPARVREPGVQSTYSNYAVALAGYIVARVNGVDFHTLVEREIFAPLGMRNSTFREPYPPRADLPAPMPKELAQNVSPGFRWQGGVFQPLDHFEYLSNIGPAGSVSTTAADIARYMQMQLNGGSLEGATIYGPQAAKAFRTPIMQAAEGVNGWAHGYLVFDLPGGFKGYSHPGGGEAFNSMMMLVPDLRLGVFVNTNTSSGTELSSLLPRVLLERFYATAPQLQRPGDPTLLRNASRYAGSYLVTRRPYSGLGKFLSVLGQQAQVSVRAPGYLVTGTGSDARAWVPDGAPGRFRAARGNEVLTFELDSSGRAVSYADARGTGMYERVGWLMDVRLLRLLAFLTGALSLAICIAAFRRIKRGVRLSRRQRVSNTVALATAACWLVSFIALAVLLSSSDLFTTLLYGWPASSLTLASSAALVAALGSLVLAGVLPFAWQASRSEQSWSVWQTTWHTAVPVVFVLFAAQLAAWGALSPWS